MIFLPATPALPGQPAVLEVGGGWLELAKQSPALIRYLLRSFVQAEGWGDPSRAIAVLGGVFQFVCQKWRLRTVDARKQLWFWEWMSGTCVCDRAGEAG